MAKSCYFILETVKDEDGGYVPCIAVEDEPGYYRTDWNWGTDKDLAEQCVDQKNEALGINPREAFAIVLSSMAASKPGRKNR